jgi:hypothetical protein
MKKLLVYENNEDPFVIEDIIDDIIKGCVITEGFDINKLKLQDRFKLLLDIRIKSKGVSYSFTLKCPACKANTPQTVKLDKLKEKKFDKDNSGLVMLNDSISITLSHITRGMQKEAQELVRKIPELTYTQQLMETVTYSMALSVKSVLANGEEIKDSPLDDIVFVLDNVPDEEFAKLKNWYIDNDFGVVFKYKQACRHCDYVKEIDIPISNFFT